MLSIMEFGMASCPALKPEPIQVLQPDAGSLLRSASGWRGEGEPEKSNVCSLEALPAAVSLILTQPERERCRPAILPPVLP